MGGCKLANSSSSVLHLHGVRVRAQLLFRYDLVLECYERYKESKMRMPAPLSTPCSPTLSTPCLPHSVPVLTYPQYSVLTHHQYSALTYPQQSVLNHPKSSVLTHPQYVPPCTLASCSGRCISSCMQAACGMRLHFRG